MKRTILLERHTCNECEARKLDVRFADLFAFVERQRRADETLPDALKRIVYDRAFGLYGRDYVAVAKLLSMNANSVNGIMARRDREAAAERFTKARAV